MTLSLKIPTNYKFDFNALVAGFVSQAKKSIGFTSNKNFSGFTEIKDLVQRLANLPNVEAARAISSKIGDLHELTFEILSHGDFDEARQLAEQATALVIETEWKLCDISKNENWYFGTQVLRKFKSNFQKNQIVAFSYAQSECLSAAS